MNKKAQSTIEYTAIAILVMVGILFIGPYVVRAVNSHFKGLEDQAEDSIEEEFIQSPPLNVDLPTCDCSPLQFCRCGSGEVGDCDRQEELWCVTCNPPGCGLELEECRPNPQVNWPIYDKCCTEWSCTGDTADCLVCPPDQGEKERYCGEENIRETQCEFCPECSFSCTGGVDSCADHFSCGDNPPNIMDTPWSHVDPGGCTAGFECEAECPPPLIGGPGGCDCPPDLTETGMPQCDCICDETPSPGNIQPTWQCAAYAPCCGGAVREDIVYSTTTCPPGYHVDQGSCYFPEENSGGGPGSLIFFNGPSPDGKSWLCAGRTEGTTGGTCHFTRLGGWQWGVDPESPAVWCVRDCASNNPPKGNRVHLQPPWCGSDLTGWQTACRTEPCSAFGGGLFWGCNGSCGASVSTTCVYPVDPVGRLAYGDPPPPGSVPIYLEAAGCGDGQQGHRNGLDGQFSLSPTCEAKKCKLFWGGWTYNRCDGVCIGASQSTCNNTLVGYVVDTPQAGSVEILQEPPGCGGDLTVFSPTCKAEICWPEMVNNNNYRSCDDWETCQLTQDDCPTVPTGLYLLPP